MSHTPGPWHVGKSSMNRLVYADHEHAFDLAIVRNGGSDTETEANARLIAASPNMLEVLEKVAGLFGAHSSNTELGEGLRRMQFDVKGAVAQARHGT